MNMPQDASRDQSNCPSGYYRNTSSMVMQIPAQPEQSAVAGVLSDEQLQDMDYLRRMTRRKLAEVILNSPATPHLVPALKEMTDRLDGKAKERVEVNHSGAMVHFNVNEGSELIFQGIKDKLAKRRIPLIDSKDGNTLINTQPIDN